VHRWYAKLAKLPDRTAYRAGAADAPFGAIVVGLVAQSRITCAQVIQAAAGSRVA